MKPSRILKVYAAVAFAVGLVLSIPVALCVDRGELEVNAGAVLALSWNVLFLMILPLILDSCERTYFKARFVKLEELAATNPELKSILDEQCSRLSLPGLRLAAVDTPGCEAFTYGLLRQNPRLIVPASWLASRDRQNLLPSIEVQLSRFARQDLSVVFLLFAVVQIIAQQVIIAVF